MVREAAKLGLDPVFDACSWLSDSYKSRGNRKDAPTLLAEKGYKATEIEERWVGYSQDITKDAEGFKAEQVYLTRKM